MAMAETIKFPHGQGSLYLFDNSPNWYSSISVNGRDATKSTGTPDLKLAKRIHRQRLDELAVARQGRGEFLLPAQQKVKVGTLLDDLARDQELRGLKSFDKLLSHAKPIREHFGSRPAAQVTYRAVEEYVAKRLADGKANATVNRETEVLRRALRLGQDRGLVASIPKIRALPENNTREGFFERREIEAVISHLPEQLRDMVRFAYLCGWRFGEITGLRWTDVDLNARVIRLRAEESKNGQGRVLALEGELWDVIQRRLAARLLPTLLDRIKEATYVFHRRGKRIIRMTTSWNNACRKAGCEGRLFHDLRRTAVRNMIRAGVPQHVAMKVSGHRTASMFARYNIVDEQDLRSAAHKVQLYVDTLPTRG